MLHQREGSHERGFSSKGGISDYNPTEANRHTKVLLYMK